MRDLSPILLVTTEEGRYHWDWVLSQLTFTPKGKRTAVESWPAHSAEAALIGVFRAAGARLHVAITVHG
jgi:hypothetical protein